MRRWRSAAIVTAVASIALLPAVPGVASASGKGSSKAPIKVGLITTLTGIAAPDGPQLVHGWDLALKKFGSKIDGHKIKTYVEDSASTPTVALSKAKYLAESEHVNLLETPILAPTQAAVESYAGPLHIPVDEEAICSITQLLVARNYHNAFTSTWVCNTDSIVAAKYMYKDLGYRHVTVMGMNYAFGWESVGGFIQEFKRLGGKIDAAIWNPLNAKDMTPYVAQIPSTTQAVYAEEAGSFSPLLTQAYAGLGLYKKIPLFGNTTVYDYSVLPAEARTQVLGGEMFAQYCDGVKNPLNDSFTRAYFDAYHTYPGYYGEAGYVEAELLVAAMKKLHGVATNQQAVTKALMSIPITAPRGPVTLTKKVLGPVQNQYLCKVETVKGHLEDVAIKTFRNVKPWGPLPYTSWFNAFKTDSTSAPST